ncbi:hypothetical protein R1flu_014604 [Riccia fluitans]|uniref:Uncharacterized protein n=1 Tax=Riccia fluitans TaxID=41844 RepID=A0ABD1YGY5_9MARC
MAGSREERSLRPSTLLMRRSSWPKMKAPKRRINYPRSLPPINLPMQPATQTSRLLPAPSVPTAPTTTAEPKEQCYDDPEICTFCDDGGQSIISCEGLCHRHFHAKKEDVARVLGCPTLKYTTKTLEAWDASVFHLWRVGHIQGRPTRGSSLPSCDMQEVLPPSLHI